MVSQKRPLRLVEGEGEAVVVEDQTFVVGAGFLKNCLDGRYCPELLLYIAIFLHHNQCGKIMISCSILHSQKASVSISLAVVVFFK